MLQLVVFDYKIIEANHFVKISSPKLMLSIRVLLKPLDEGLIFEFSKSYCIRVIFLSSVYGELLVCSVGLRGRVVKFAIFSTEVNVRGNP